MKIIAHRGLSWRFPENTLRAFKEAAAAGADLIELDFHTTSDGVLVCAHDETLDRYLAGQRPDLAGRKITELPYGQLRTLDMGLWKHERFAGTRITSLREVLEHFSAVQQPTLLIEHKTGTAELLLTDLDEVATADRVIVQSFDWSFLKELHASRPDIRLAALGSDPITHVRMREMLALQVLAAHWEDTSVDAQTVADVHAAGLQLWIWTVDSEMAFRGAAAMGIDGITTNRCDFARQVLRAP